MGSALEPLSCALPEGAIWRLWQEADFIQPLGLSGRKKVSDALTQAKVPSPVRREVVVLALDSGPGEVLWIPGIRLSQTIALALDADNALRWTLNYL
jgi:tRNA(Ile)-lysidine synthase